MIKKILAVVILGMVGVVGVIGLTSGEILKPHTIRYGAQQVQDDGEMRERRVRVRRVIDGDTFKTEQGESVRIIGVDAPERKELSSKKSSELSPNEKNLKFEENPVAGNLKIEAKRD